MELTQEKAHELFEYKNGELFWKTPKRGVNKNVDGDYPVGWNNGFGYKCLSINNKKYYTHQIVFLMQHGYIPKLIDHIDGNGMNNKIENLREADKAKNACNSKIRCDNTSGHRGVVWHKNAKKWGVRLNINKKTKHIGLYDDFELACLVSDEARNLYYGSFARI
jgi:hypothetical protein